jgi:hypothetical protein
LLPLRCLALGVQSLLQFDHKRVLRLPDRRKEIALDINVHPVEGIPLDVIHELPHKGRPGLGQQHGFRDRIVGPAAAR